MMSDCEQSRWLAYAENDKDGEKKMEDLCCILASLMHQEVTTLHVPKFFIRWSPNTEALLQKLVKVVCDECPKLTSLDWGTLYRSSPCLSSGVGDTFFSALPQLVNLRSLKIEIFSCDDWALQQIAEHCTNLV
jgi:hypothetical protein